MVDYHPGDLVVKNVPSRSGCSKSSQVLLVIEVGHSIKLKSRYAKLCIPMGVLEHISLITLKNCEIN